MGKVPSGFRLLLVACGVLFAAFLATGPWRFGSITVHHISIVLGAIALTILLALAIRPVWRDHARRWIVTSEIVLPNRMIVLLSIAVALFLGRTIHSQWVSMQINAWDFSLYFDRPLALTSERLPLFSDYTGASTLATHAWWLMFVFVPAYAIAPSPMWLLGAQALAIAAAAAVGFLLFRRLGGDDLAALILATAFVLNGYTARAVRFAFHVEIFYPLALFLVAWSMVAGRRGVFLLALVLTVSIKEDAIVPLVGLGIAAALFQRRWRWGAVAIAAGVAGYLADTRLLMPWFSGESVPWYSWYWTHYGADPLSALGAMMSHPTRVASDLGSSGVWRLLRTTLFLPVLGLEWSVAALPGLVMYGIARHEKLSRFALYYSMPLLPFLFAALPVALLRTARLFGSRSGHETDYPALRARYRVGAVIVLLACAFDSSQYRLDVPRAERLDVQPALSMVRPGLTTFVQGSLLPHAGYERNLRVLESTEIDGRSAWLIAPNCDPYPLGASGIRELETRLAADQRYDGRTTEHGLLLFAPIAQTATIPTVK